MTLLDIDRPRTPIARLLSAVERRVPTGLSRVLEQARRDIAVVEGRLLRGDKPSPVLVRRTMKVDAATRAQAPSADATKPTQLAPAPAKDTASVLTIEDAGGSFVVRVAPDRYVLESALEQGASIPFSCTLGGCGSCKVTLLEGAIEVDDPHCLTPEEIDAGVRLSCVGRVTSPTCRVRLERDPA